MPKTKITHLSCFISVEQPLRTKYFPSETGSPYQARQQVLVEQDMMMQTTRCVGYPTGSRSWHCIVTMFLHAINVRPGCCRATPWWEGTRLISVRTVRIESEHMQIVYKFEPFIARLKSELSIVKMSGRFDHFAPLLRGDVGINVFVIPYRWGFIKCGHIIPLLTYLMLAATVQYVNELFKFWERRETKLSVRFFFFGLIVRMFESTYVHLN